MKNAPFKRGELVINRKQGWVGKVIDAKVAYYPKPFFFKKDAVEWRWQIKVKPVHDVVGRNTKKAHYYSVSSLRKATPLELLAAMAE